MWTVFVCASTHAILIEMIEMCDMHYMYNLHTKCYSYKVKF